MLELVSTEAIEVNQRLHKCLMDWWQEQIGPQASNRLAFLPDDSYCIKTSLHNISEQIALLAILVEKAIAFDKERFIAKSR